MFLCENGGVIYKDEQCIAKNPMPRALAEEIANDLWTRSDGQGEVMLSGQNTAYLMERGLGMLKRIQFIGNNYQIIHDPSEVPEEITKVSVYLHEGVESYIGKVDVQSLADAAHTDALVGKGGVDPVRPCPEDVLREFLKQN